MKPIVVSDYDPGWVKVFENTSTRLAPALVGIASAIEHVGSTAVPGLAAKPIADMDVIVPTSADVPRAIRALSGLGYEHRGDLGIPGREAFEPPASSPPQHLQVCVEGCLALRNHLGLRDHLRRDADAARAYGDRRGRRRGR